MTPLSIFLIDLLVKVTLVLGAAHLALALVRNRSAGTRHLVVSSAIIALLALPVTIAMPGIVEIPVPAAPEATPEPVPAEMLLLRTSLAEPSADDSEASPAADVDVVGAAGPQSSSDGTPAAKPREVSVPIISYGSMFSWIGRKMTPPVLFAAVWGIGSILMLLHLLSGVLRVQWIVERALPLTDGKTRSLLEQTSRRVGLPRTPRLLISPEISVPVVWGIGAATLLLPLEAENWSDDRRRAVFLHEIAHISRRDGLTLILTRLAVALYWIHPLIWTASKVARRCCEHACDDIVLQRGTRPSEYADHLLDIARTLPERERIATVALAMSRRSEIEGRLLAILHPGLRRSSMTRAGALITFVAATALVASLSSVRLAADEQKKEAEIPAADIEEPDLEVRIDAESTESAWASASSRFELEADMDTETSRNENTNWNVNTNRNGSQERTAKRDEKKDAKRDLRKEQKSEAARIWEKAWSAHQDDRFNESIPLFMKTAELGFRPGASRYNVACGFAMQGDAPNAVRWIEEAIDHGFDRWDLLLEDSDLDPIRSDPSFQAVIESGDSAEFEKYSHHRTQEALEELAQLSASNSKDSSDWGSAGRKLLGLRRLAEAEVALRRAIELAGSAPVVAKYNMACLESLRGNTSESLRWLDDAIESGFDQTDKIENDPDLETIRGTSQYQSLIKKSRALSISQFMKYDKGEESSADDDRARWRPAIELYSRYTSERPDSGRAWWNLGYARHMSGMYEPAIEAFAHAIDLGYREANSSYNIACGHARLGHLDLAFQWLERSAQYGFELGERIESDEDLASLRSDPRAEELFHRDKKERYQKRSN